MAKKQNIDTMITRIVKRYIRNIQTRGVRIEKAIIFGSWAKGIATDESDIDVCLVSRDFGRNEIKEQQFLLYQTHEVDDRIEPVPMSITDFDTNATPLIDEIKKYGQVVKV